MIYMYKWNFVTICISDFFIFSTFFIIIFSLILKSLQITINSNPIHSFHSGINRIAKSQKRKYT